MAVLDQMDWQGSIRFTSWNVRGLGGPIKRARVFSHLRNLKLEVIFLQETHLRVCDHTRLCKPWIGQVFHSSFNSRSRGTAILVHKKLQFSPEQIIPDPNERYIIVVGKLLQTPVILVCSYAPNWDCPHFMTALFSLIPCLDSYHLIFGGDLNLVIDPTLDKSNPKNLTSSWGAPLLLDLDLILKCERHSTWRLNTGLLSSNTFCKYISEKISFFVQTNKSESTSPSLSWESLKAVIRGEVIFCSARLSKKWKQRQQELLEAIRQIDRQHSSSPNIILQTERLKLQTEFYIISTNKAELLLRRTKSMYYEHGDRASRLLALTLKRQATSRFLTQICKNLCTLARDPVGINNIFA